jgi:hypothetical protein
MEWLVAQWDGWLHLNHTASRERTSKSSRCVCTLDLTYPTRYLILVTRRPVLSKGGSVRLLMVGQGPLQAVYGVPSLATKVARAQGLGGRTMASHRGHVSRVDEQSSVSRHPLAAQQKTRCEEAG